MIQNFVISIRMIFGTMFLLFGLNSFFHFFSIQSGTPKAEIFVQALIQTGYLWGFVHGVEVLCGALLVTGLFIPLALLILFPVVLNIFLFHLFLAPSQLLMALGILTCEVCLLWYYRKSYQGILSVKV